MKKSFSRTLSVLLALSMLSTFLFALTDVEAVVIPTADYISLYTDEGTSPYGPIQVTHGDVGQKFTVPAGKQLEYVKFPKLPTWNVPSDVDLEIYTWNTNYATSVAGDVLATHHETAHKDGALLVFAPDAPLGAGDYLVVLKQKPGYTCGVWSHPKKGDTTLFLNGNERVNESARMLICVSGTETVGLNYKTYNTKKMFLYDNTISAHKGHQSADGGDIAQMFTVPTGSVLKTFQMDPVVTWSKPGLDVEYVLYSWDNNYANTIQGQKLAVRYVENHVDNMAVTLNFEDVYLPGGDYLIVMKQTAPGITIGALKKTPSSACVTYFNGTQVDWTPQSFIETKVLGDLDNLPIESNFNLDFSKQSDINKVTNYTAATISKVNDVMRIDFAASGDPGVHIRFADANPWEVDVSIYKYIAFKVKRSAGTQLNPQIFYNNIAQGGADDKKSISLNYANTTEWQNLVFDFSAANLPLEGIVNYFRFDTFNSSNNGDFLEVESIRFFKTKAAADASFFCPIGEDPNQMQMPSIHSAYVGSQIRTKLVPYMDSNNVIVEGQDRQGLRFCFDNVAKVNDIIYANNASYKVLSASGIVVLKSKLTVDDPFTIDNPNVQVQNELLDYSDSSGEYKAIYVYNIPESHKGAVLSARIYYTCEDIHGNLYYFYSEVKEDSLTLVYERMDASAKGAMEVDAAKWFAMPV